MKRAGSDLGTQVETSVLVFCLNILFWVFLRAVTETAHVSALQVIDSFIYIYIYQSKHLINLVFLSKMPFDLNATQTTSSSLNL